MLTVLKIAGLSALLSAGVVTAYEAPRTASSDSVKLFQDRVAADLPAHVAAPVTAVRLADMGGSIAGPDINRAAKGDAAPTTAGCSAQAWPHVLPGCVPGSDGSARKVRVISLESRPAAAASDLTKAAARR